MNVTNLAKTTPAKTTLAKTKPAKTKPNSGVENNSGDRILGVAAGLFARYGYAGTSIAMILSGSGVTAPSLYWHFKSKDQLFAAVINEGSSRFFERAEKLSQDLASVGSEQNQIAMIEQAINADLSFLRAMMMAALTEDVMASEEIRNSIAAIRKAAQTTWREKCRALLRAYPKAIADAVAEEYAEVGLTLFEGAFIAQGLDGYSNIASFMRRFERSLKAVAKEMMTQENDNAAIPNEPSKDGILPFLPS